MIDLSGHGLGGGGHALDQFAVGLQNLGEVGHHRSPPRADGEHRQGVRAVEACDEGQVPGGDQLGQRADAAVEGDGDHEHGRD